MEEEFEYGRMEGFVFNDGSKVTADVLRQTRFILGKAKMQMSERGVVELSDGTVRVYSVFHDHHPGRNGVRRLVGEPFRWALAYDEVVESLRAVEQQWITEEPEPYVRHLIRNPAKH